MTNSGTKPPLEGLLMRIKNLLAFRRYQLLEDSQPALDRVLDGVRTAELPSQWPSSKRRSVCRFLPELLSLTAELDPQLSRYLQLVEHSLYWRQRYDTGPVSETFFDNFGLATLVSPDGPAVNATVKVGLIILGPGELYPNHAHPAGEFYAILAGSPDWRIGDGPWHSRQPGDLIHHEPNVPHAARTRDNALLALYAWYGAIHEPPRFV